MKIRFKQTHRIIKGLLWVALFGVLTTFLSFFYTRVDLVKIEGQLNSQGNLEVVVTDVADQVFFSYTPVEVQTCGIYCVNYKGFPIAYYYFYTDTPLSLENFILNSTIYAIGAGIIFVIWKRYRLRKHYTNDKKLQI